MNSLLNNQYLLYKYVYFQDLIEALDAVLAFVEEYISTLNEDLEGKYSTHLLT